MHEDCEWFEKELREIKRHLEGGSGLILWLDPTTTDSLCER